MSSRTAGVLLVIPAVVVYAVTTLAPAWFVVRTSLYDSSFIAERWVGLGNYIATFSDKDWWRSVWITARMSAVIVPAQTLLPLGLALLLATERKGLRAFVQAAFHLPAVVAGAVFVGVWKWLYAREGVLNGLLAVLGIRGPDWLAEPVTALAAICAAVVVVSMGGSLILYLSQLQAMDKDVLAAAQIDGASPRQIRWRIMAPELWPTAGLFSMLALIAAFQVWFLPYILTSGGPAHATETIMFNIYREGFWLSRYGMANARSVVLVLLVVALTVTQRRLAR